MPLLQLPGGRRVGGRPGHGEDVEGGVELLLGEVAVADVAAFDTTSRIVRRSFSACFATAAASS